MLKSAKLDCLDLLQSTCLFCTAGNCESSNPVVSEIDLLAAEHFAGVMRRSENLTSRKLHPKSGIWDRASWSRTSMCRQVCNFRSSTDSGMPGSEQGSVAPRIVSPKWRAGDLAFGAWPSVPFRSAVRTKGSNLCKHSFAACGVRRAVPERLSS